jgi:WhiB family redox-sensing transcriptional regulator
MDWRHRGACLTKDPELFFPIGTGEVAAVQSEKAKRVCGSCQVRTHCLEWAMSANVDGIWGGLDEGERRSLRRKARRSAA